MRIYTVTAKTAKGRVLRKRVAGSMLASRDARRNLADAAGVPLKQVDVDEFLLPTMKVDLLLAINSLLSPYDEKVME